jgi:macrolide-specific efflux system membrane fusion protein
MKKAIKWTVVLAVVAGGGYGFYRSKTKTELEAKPTYDRATVEIRDLRTTVESTGEVQPRNRLDVKPPISGRLEELLVDEGDEVKKGQILGWISSTERATLLDAALANGTEEMEYWEKLYKPSPLISPLAGTIIARNFEPGQSIGVNDAVVVIADALIVVANLDETDIGQVELGQTVDAHLEAYPDTSFDCVVEKIAYDARLVSNVTMYDVDVRANALPDFARSGMTANLEFVLEERKGVLAIDSSAIKESKPPKDDEMQKTNMAEDGDVAARREMIMKKMRERGMSDTEIRTRMEKFKSRAGQSGGSTKRPLKQGGEGEVLIDSGNPEAPVRRKVRIGISDGIHVEILEGLEEGDQVLIEKIMTGQREASRSPFMPRRK